MKTLIAFATGGRPRTAAVMKTALDMVVHSRQDLEVTEVQWMQDTDLPSFSSPWRVIQEDDATPGHAYNLALNEYFARVGDLPDYFVTMDDDAVIGERTIDRMIKVVSDHHNIGLLGAWNDLSERNRGSIVATEDELIQVDDGAGEPYCVGGALHVIPKRVLFKIRKRAPDGNVYPEVPRREDEGLTARVRDLGMNACLAISIPVALLPDDGVNEWYRPRILAMHYNGV